MHERRAGTGEEIKPALYGSSRTHVSLLLPLDSPGSCGDCSPAQHVCVRTRCSSTRTWHKLVGLYPGSTCSSQHDPNKSLHGITKTTFVHEITHELPACSRSPGRTRRQRTKVSTSALFAGSCSEAAVPLDWSKSYNWPMLICSRKPVYVCLRQCLSVFVTMNIHRCRCR